MHYRIYSLGFALVLAFSAGISATAESGVVSASEQTPCSDTIEAAEWTQHVAASLLGVEEEDLAFREATGLERVDSSAVVGAITDGAICSAVAAALQIKLAQQSFPYRLVYMEIGPYYVVAAIDTTPPPPGVYVARRTLVFVLAKSDLSLLVDNWLV